MHPDRPAALRLAPRSAVALAVLLAAAVAAAGARPAPAPASAPPLAAQLSRALAVPHVDARRTAAVVVDLRAGDVVYARRESLSLAPASAEKLPVSYALLSTLGPEYRIRTRVLGEGRLEGGTWRGRLVLKGYGDPTLSRAGLRGLARVLRARGITRVTGRIVGDESYFDARRTAPGWRSWYYASQCAPLSALTVDGARYHGRVSHRPALAAVLLFRDALRAAGVAVHGSVTVGRAGPAATPLASTASAPLASLVRRVNRDSDNFTAETLLKHLGAARASSGTTAAGARVVRETLWRAGIPLAGVRIADGSGLSLLDRATAAQLVGVLVAAWTDPALRAPFVRSLAVAGRTGTLKRRLRARAVAGRVAAKTGTTREASALAGYVGDRYAFAIVQNGRPVSWHWARTAQDRFVQVLASRR
ncbi:MAG: D-alanyl-D-alanine carboxypeptidase/D-alanyl-D-alanine-endopeptidase [Thermoleophilia bacterium]|nr:D-alanyl-D-alanine carboxypeptidase/D-alanyl-D-alanine-endopeptidase [Thermoleophilia bacterium]